MPPTIKKPSPNPPEEATNLEDLIQALTDTSSPIVFVDRDLCEEILGDDAQHLFPPKNPLCSVNRGQLLLALRAAKVIKDTAN